MRKVIPTVFAHNKKEFDLRFRKLVKISRDIQIDFMDGKFVKSKGIRISDIPVLKRYGARFEAHLMMRNPEKYIEKLKEKGFSKIIFHVEAGDAEKIGDVIDLIKKNKMKAWIALNPGTGIKKILPFMGRVDGILFMGVYPGKEHQKFVNSVYRKIRNFRKENSRIKIQVDGGVNLESASRLKKIGVNYVNSGSFIFEAENPGKALSELKKKFN